MKKYRVYVPEVHYQAYLIEAESESEAIDLVADMQGEIQENDFSYSHTLDKDKYKVEVENV